jgi:hypothetical protein
MARQEHVLQLVREALDTAGTCVFAVWVMNSPVRATPRAGLGGASE